MTAWKSQHFADGYARTTSYKAGWTFIARRTRYDSMSDEWISQAEFDPISNMCSEIKGHRPLINAATKDDSLFLHNSTSRWINGNVNKSVHIYYVKREEKEK